MSSYDFELDLLEQDTIPVMIKRISSGAKILEFGPANGRLTEHLVLEKNVVLT